MMESATYGPMVPIVLFGWIPLVLVLFGMLPARRAVIVAFLFAWLFLPVAEYEFKSLPEYNKTSATCAGVLLAILVLDFQQLFKFRPRWFDLPVLAFSLCPVASSLTNGLGLYDGFSEAFGQSVRWLLPYFIGRLYFSDLENLRELVIGIFIGGLVYVPLCLWEIRMSPQLHRQVYGFAPTVFAQVVRYGGYRPVVFIGGSGLLLGLYMGFATLCGFWLWYTRSLRGILGVPMYILVPVIFITTILGKSTGAIILMLLGMGALVAAKHLRSSLPVVALAVAPVLFIAIRATGLWEGQALVDTASNVFGPDRAQSLDTRFHNENLLRVRAWQSPLFGWGGWGRSRIYDESGRDITITDSLWIIAFGENGLVGLSAVIATVLLPALLLKRRAEPPLWVHPMVASAAACAVMLCLGLINNCLNAAVMPVSILMMGGLNGMETVVPRVVLPPSAKPASGERAEPSLRELVRRRRASLKRRPPGNSESRD